MLKTYSKAVCDAVQIRLQQLMSKFPGGRFGGPGHTIFFIGTDQHTATFLTHVDFALKIDGVADFAACFFVELGHFRHIVGDQVHVLHCQDWQFEPNHATTFTCPQTASVNNVFSVDCPLLGHNIPGAVGPLVGFNNAVAQDDFRAQFLSRPRIGICRARGVKVTFFRIIDRTFKLARVDQREVFFGFLRRDQLRLHAQATAFGVCIFQKVHPVFCGCQHDTAGHMNTTGLAGQFLNFLVKIDGVCL